MENIKATIKETEKSLTITVKDKNERLIYNLRFDQRDNGIIELHERNENGVIREETIII